MIYVFIVCEINSMNINRDANITNFMIKYGYKIAIYIIDELLFRLEIRLFYHCDLIS